MFNLTVLIWCLLNFSTSVENRKTQEATPDSLSILYKECSLDGLVDFSIFQKSVAGIQHYQPTKRIVTIVDFSLPSDRKRFFVIDLDQKKLLLSTWVAHGKKSGLRMAEHFSNVLESHQSSSGFYRVGKPIQSPKHGSALLLFGLEKGINDNAERREIILHGAAYVSEDFVKKNGRCGRSFGCPALPLELMPKIVPMLSNGSLLYIHTEQKKQRTNA